MSSTSMHIVTNDRISLFLCVKKYIPSCTHFTISLSMYYKRGEKTFHWWNHFVIFGYIPRGGLEDPLAMLFLAVSDIFMMLPILAVPIRIPINSIETFLFSTSLPAVVSLWLGDNGHSHRRDQPSLCIIFALPSWRIILRICICCYCIFVVFFFFKKSAQILFQFSN